MKKSKSIKLIFLLWILTAFLPASAEEKRIALLIGNNTYSEGVGALQNPENDVDKMAQTLATVGFEPNDITILKNASRVEMLEAISDFASSSEELTSEDLAFFFYSGHGARRPRTLGTKLLPTSIGHLNDDRFWFETVDFENDVIRTLQDANPLTTWVLVVDACRNELLLPTKSVGGTTKSFGLIPEAAGMLIAFAADKGQTSWDSFQHSTVSPYVDALSQSLLTPGQTLSETFAKVRREVIVSTGGAQEPVFSHRLNKEVVLIEPLPVMKRENVAWAVISRMGTLDSYEVYLELFPNSSFSEIARQKLSDGFARQPFDKVPAWQQFSKNDWSLVSGRVLLRSTLDAHDLAQVAEAALSGDANASTILGYAIFYQYGGVVSQPSLAAEHFKIGCNGGNQRACFFFGVMLARGLGVEPDQSRSIELLDIACAQGIADSCYELGLNNSKGSWGASVSEIDAATYHVKGCDLGHPDSCARAARALLEGDGLEQDKELGLSYAHRACEHGDPYGCRAYGQLFELGLIDEKPDFERALELYLQACDAGNGDGCSEAGRLIAFGQGHPPSPTEGFQLKQRGCELKSAIACGTMAGFFTSGFGSDVDHDEALRSFERSCELNYPNGCAVLGQMAYDGTDLVPQDFAEAHKYFELSCSLGSGDGCRMLGLMYSRGQFVDLDFERSIETWERACDLKDFLSCLNISFHYKSGIEGQPNQQKAAEWFDRTCELEPPSVEYAAVCAIGSYAIYEAPNVGN